MKKNIPLSVIGCDAPASISSRLHEFGFEVVVIERDARLPLPTASHADMILLRMFDTFFCNQKYYKNFEKDLAPIKERGYKIFPIECEISDRYPHDIPLNLALVGNYLFGKLEHIPDEIKLFAKKHDIIPVSVKQGYAKCSTLILGENAIITADESISNAALKNNIDVLKIENSPSAVSLKGYNYGFIGGACGVFQNKIYFTGNIDIHPNSDKIKLFCQKHGFEIISLDDDILVDIGGIIFAEPLT